MVWLGLYICSQTNKNVFIEIIPKIFVCYKTCFYICNVNNTKKGLKESLYNR